MAIELMVDVWALDIPAKDQRVLLLLANHANHEGVCWPSIGHMAWSLGCDEKTVRRAIDDLEGQGILTVERRPNRSSVYQIDLSGATRKAPYQPASTGQNARTVRPSGDKMPEPEIRTGHFAPSGPDILSVWSGQNVLQNRKEPTPETKGGTASPLNPPDFSVDTNGPASTIERNQLNAKWDEYTNAYFDGRGMMSQAERRSNYAKTTRQVAQAFPDLASMAEVSPAELEEATRVAVREDDPRFVTVASAITIAVRDRAPALVDPLAGLVGNERSAAITRWVELWEQRNGKRLAKLDERFWLWVAAYEAARKADPDGDE